VAVEDGAGYTPCETAVAAGNMAAATLLCGVSRAGRSVAAAAALDALVRTYPGLERATRGAGSELAAWQWQFGSPALAGRVALPPMLTALAAHSPASLLLWLQVACNCSARLRRRRRPPIHVAEGDAMLHVLACAASAAQSRRCPRRR